MSGKVTRQVRKTVNSERLLLITQVLDFIEKEATKKNFFQRFKIAMRYLFKKDFRAVMGE